MQSPSLQSSWRVQKCATTQTYCQSESMTLDFENLTSDVVLWVVAVVVVRSAQANMLVQKSWNTRMTRSGQFLKVAIVGGS